tara:strand:+ start:884 stop:1537 length:654 start_codon:yes stop_codon:yes gene_type:complete
MRQRWGRPIKNTKSQNPRYFLLESSNPDQEEESDFVNRFEKLVNSLSYEQLTSSEIKEGDNESPLVKTNNQELYLSDESKKYMINFIRRRAIGAVSFKLRALLLVGTKTTMGTLLAGLAAAGYGPKRLYKMTSVDELDKIIEKILKQYMSQASQGLYPGDTDLKKIMLAVVQEFVRFYRELGQSLTQKYKSLPAPEQKQAKHEINQQFKKLKQEADK